MTGTDRRPGGSNALVVVPTLNEERDIGAVLDALRSADAETRLRHVVADGGSTDRTPDIVAAAAARRRDLTLIHNLDRLQGAAVNLAVERLGADAEFLIRVDAHASYPQGFCRRLIEEARATGADAVVVSMRAEGTGCFQRGVAAAQNSLLGTGGSAHRIGRGGQWVDHGHHALMRLQAFRRVGGYDPTFTHNEDAELDFRLRRAGFRIWLSAETRIVYIPRATPGALFRQYRNYGRGRARTLLKHTTWPRLRQTAPLAAPLAAAGLGLGALAAIGGAPAGVTAVLCLPAAAWITACLGVGVRLAVAAKDACVLCSALAAMIMHLAWGYGFLEQVLRSVHGGRR